LRINGIEYFEHYNTARLLAPEPQPYSMQTVSRAFGFKWVNDSFSQTANRLWYALAEVCGKIVLIIQSSIHFEKELDVVGALLSEKVNAVISIGHENIGSDALAPFVPALIKVKSISEAILVAKRVAKPTQTILYCPAVYAIKSGFPDYESRGLEFNRQLNLIS